MVDCSGGSQIRDHPALIRPGGLGAAAFSPYIGNMKYKQQMAIGLVCESERLRTVGAAGVGLLWLVLVGLLGVSCSDSTNPEDVGPPRVGFSPDVDSLVLNLNAQRLFVVELQNVPGAQVRICRGESLLGTQATYLYQATRVGLDSLCATVTFADSTVSKTWRIRVALGSAGLTPPVHDLRAVPGQDPGSILLTWDQPALMITPRPLIRYLVGVSAIEFSSEDEWPLVTIIDSVPDIAGHYQYRHLYDDDDYPVLTPGEDMWVAVRVEDVAGVLSNLSSVRRLRITTPYWLQGVVRDDAAEPLMGVLVDYGCDTCKTLTDAAGEFELGPFRDIDKYVLHVRDDAQGTGEIGEFYDFLTDTLSAETPSPLRILLIQNYGLEDACDGYYNGGDFLTYFRTSTNTHVMTINRPNYKLLKWEEYPLRVHIHQTMNADSTFAMDEVARMALADWNGRMGDTYLVEVADPAQAQVRIEFSNSGLCPGCIGQTILEVPTNYQLSEAIPQRVLVKVKISMVDPVDTHEVLLHELGHALLLKEHSVCIPPNRIVHVMSPNPKGIIEDRFPDWPISIDEMHAVRAIRNLPQGQDMSRYLLE
jgi:hypothetical protein